MSDKQPQSHNIFFDPQKHPDNTLKSFTQFTQTFQLRYAAQFPDPPKVSLDSVLNRWKIMNTTTEVPNPKPTINEYDALVANWQSKDKVAKFLGMFSSTNFHNDWLAAQPDETLRTNAGWTDLVRYMSEYYKPTENLTLKNFHFRALSQSKGQTFSAFCNEVEKEAKHCSFKCHHDDCTAEAIAVRDQIVFGTTNDKIREEAFIKTWDLANLRKEGMRMESASKGAAELSGEHINRVGPYSHKNIRSNKNNDNRNTPKTLTPLICFNCGTTVTTPIKTHTRRDCPALGKTCAKCNKEGHFAQCCRKFPDVKQVQPADNPPPTDDDEDTYNINIFHLDTLNSLDATLNDNIRMAQVSDTPVCQQQTSNKHVVQNNVEEQPSTMNTDVDTYAVNAFVINSSKNQVLPKLKPKTSDFRATVIVNNCVGNPIADTGAKVSVCGTLQAKRWNLLGRMIPSTKKLKPYNSSPIPVLGTARCAVTFGTTSVPVEWHIISGSCEPILSGNSALQLGIIKFRNEPNMFHPVLMIDDQAIGTEKERVQSVLQQYPQNFTGLGRLKNHTVKLHVHPNTKPIRHAPRPTWRTVRMPPYRRC